MAGIVALPINEGAYMSEIIRAGIDSVDMGQMEAARRWACRSGWRCGASSAAGGAGDLPPLGNEFNNMLKTTSLLAFIGVYELFEDADVHYSSSFKPVEYFTAVAFWYLVLTSVWSIVQSIIERKLAVGDRVQAPGFADRLNSALGPVNRWRAR